MTKQSIGFILMALLVVSIPSSFGQTETSNSQPKTEIEKTALKLMTLEVTREVLGELILDPRFSDDVSQQYLYERIVSVENAIEFNKQKLKDYLDWEARKGNILPKSDTKGDPIAFSLPGVCDTITTERVWENETADSRIWKMRLNNLDFVSVDTNIISGCVLFHDEDGNNYPSNGNEFGMSPFWPEYENSYKFFAGPAFDFTHDGKLSSRDTEFHKFRIWITDTDRVVRPSQIGITHFDVANWLYISDDYVGTGKYINCNDYVKDWAYWKYTNEQHEGDEGWCQSVGIHHSRASSWNPVGITLEDGTTLPTYGIVLGYWGETSQWKEETEHG